MSGTHFFVFVVDGDELIARHGETFTDMVEAHTAARELAGEHVGEYAVEIHDAKTGHVYYRY